MKKFLSIALSLAMMCSLSATAFAADNSGISEQTETEISMIPEEITNLHQQSLLQKNAVTSTYNEYEILESSKLQTNDELLEAGYSLDVIADIRSGAAEERIVAATLERAMLPETQLLEMGYTESEIISLKNLTGSESLSEISALGVLADCSTYNTYVSHVYKKSLNKTFFKVNFGWEWDKCPAWLLTDCAGTGWNQNFHPDDTGSSTYNTSYKTYVNQLNSSDKKYSSEPMYEQELGTAQDQLDMNGFFGSEYYVKSGSGTMYLSQTGRVNDVKFAFKYGHNQFGAAVSVGFPWSVGFSLEGAETVFQPQELVYHDFATTQP